MSLMEFGKEQKIGILQIDRQHKEIVDSLNHLYDIKDSGKTEILDTYGVLLGQLKNHFNTEETFMKEHKSANFISHKLEHDRAYSKYLEYYNTLRGSKIEFDSDILVSLKSWIENHIVKKDKRLPTLLNHN